MPWMPLIWELLPYMLSYWIIVFKTHLMKLTYAKHWCLTLVTLLPITSTLLSLSWMQVVPKWLLDRNKLWKKTQWKILSDWLRIWEFATTQLWIAKVMSLKAKSSLPTQPLQVLLFSTLSQQETLTKMEDQTQPKIHHAVFLRKGHNRGKTFKKYLALAKILHLWLLSWFWKIPMQRSIHQQK